MFNYDDEDEIEFDKKYLEKSIPKHIYEKAETKYKNEYNKYILKDTNKNIATFCATTARKIAIIDFTLWHDNIIRQTEYYNYVSKNIKVMLEETRINHIRAINVMLNRQIQDIIYAKQLVNYRLIKCICNQNANMRYCDYCGGLSNTTIRLKLVEAMDNANEENERVLNILRNLILNEINNEQSNK
jgi:hypothetical protein